MDTQFIVKALSIDSFRPLMVLDDDELAGRCATWLTVDSDPGYPCRVSLIDARAGERVLALPHVSEGL